MRSRNVGFLIEDGVLDEVMATVNMRNFVVNLFQFSIFGCHVGTQDWMFMDEE